MDLEGLLERAKAPVLVIACGGKKLAQGPARVMDLYTRSWWAKYRKTRRELEGVERLGEHPRVRVYVLSAEFGLLPEATMCPLYNRVLVPDSHRASTTKDGTPVRRVGEIAPLIREQAATEGIGSVVFVGGRNYYDALVRAGLDVEWMDRRDLGYKLRSLGQWLRRHA
jgi:hypothetical protein